MRLKPNTLIVVAGPTASGKTALAIKIAKAVDGEIVSADSMQIYRGVDIATAKPTPEELAAVPHHLIGFLPMDRAFSVADYAELARKEINDILSRGKVPVDVYKRQVPAGAHHRRYELGAARRARRIKQ